MHWQGNYVQFILLMVTNFFGDEIDGRLARHFGQVSSFGSNLDLILDELQNVVLITSIVLSGNAATLMILFLMTLQYVDVASCYLMLASITSYGSSHVGCASFSGYRLLNLYYNNSAFFKLLVNGELAMKTLIYYKCFILPSSGVWKLLVPFACLRLVVNVSKLMYCLNVLLISDEKALINTSAKK